MSTGDRLVELYVYDLSQGMARQMSLGFLGIQIDAVYHTSIVIGGQEYYYGHGIQYSLPGQTHHGNPIEVLPLGATSLPDDVILNYLDSLKSIYSPEAYDLFMHNCNNFTNDVAQFLCGRSIPDHITSLPQTVLDTPFGQMLKPMLDRALRPITTAPNVPSTAAPPTPRHPEPGPAQVIVADSLLHLEESLKSAESSCAVVFFTSATCGPCRAIYPRFAQMASDAGAKAKFIKVDVGVTYEAGQKYRISATPTFITFVRGEKVEEWKGASEGDLIARVNALMLMAYPPHPHTNLNLRITLSLPMNAVTFSKVPPLDKAIDKLGATGKDPIVISIREFIVARESQGAIETPVKELSHWATFLRESLNELPTESLFPLIDLFRVTLSDPRVSGWFAEEKDNSTIKSILGYVAGRTIVPYPLRLVTLQTMCNLFTSPLFPRHLTSPPMSSLLITLITTSLLDKSHTSARVAAASLLFNLVAYIQKQRATQNEEVLEDSMVELVAAAIEALKEEYQSKEVVRGLTLGLALIVYCAPAGGELFDVVKVLEAGKVVKGKGVKGGLGEKALCDEVSELLEMELG